MRLLVGLAGRIPLPSSEVVGSVGTQIIRMSKAWAEGRSGTQKFCGKLEDKAWKSRS